MRLKGKKSALLKKILVGNNFLDAQFLVADNRQLKKNQCSIKEIPITFHDRKFGKSKIPRLEIFRTLTNLFKLKFFSYFK